VAVLAAGALAAGVVWWSGVSLTADSRQLARLSLQPLAGSLVSATVTSDGKPVPASVEHGRLVPRTQLAPGAKLRVVAVVRRPQWLQWVAGKTRREELTLTTPVAAVRSAWLTATPGVPVRVRFTTGVDRVAFAAKTHAVHGGQVVSLGARRGAGSIEVAAAARPWERLGKPVRVSWFPHTSRPAVLVSPAPGAVVSPLTQVRLTFAQPVSDVLGKASPRFASRLQGAWSAPDDHTLVFRPRGFGLPLGGRLHLRLPRTLSVVGAGGAATRRGLDWTVAEGSLLRLHQLLALEGYLPVDWGPDGDAVPQTAAAQVEAAVRPPAGKFAWRYPNTPPQLTRQWNPTLVSQITRGAVMMFQHEHHLTVDGFAGPHVWQALLDDAIAGKRKADGYSYVYVHTHLPQLLTLWHNGGVVLTSPGNTGIPATPTQPGTFPVFEHIPVGTMSGTNPDGSHYNDPGIRWISYFHGGEALHAFTRASFGTPQSLGCVELPLAAAAKVWPYTPIGTLVTIEN
jgi:hypothetical protein